MMKPNFLLTLLLCSFASIGRVFASEIYSANTEATKANSQVPPNKMSISSAFFRQNHAELLFSNAVESGNVDRLRNLLYHLNDHPTVLNREQKAKIFKTALFACKYLGKGKNEVFGEIFRMLLQANFYPEDRTWPKVYDDHEYLPLRHVMNDPVLYQPFLDFDKDFFSKESKTDYIGNLIRLQYYPLVKTALDLGFKPFIEGVDRNALDYAMDKNMHYSEDGLIEIIRILREKYGLLPANTIHNLEFICAKIEDWDRAIEIVRLGEMKFEKVSPIGIAFKYRRPDLVNAAIDTYAHELSPEQLKKDLECYDRTFEVFGDDRKLLEEAVDRLETLIALMKAGWAEVVKTSETLRKSKKKSSKNDMSDGK